MKSDFLDKLSLTGLTSITPLSRTHANALLAYLFENENIVKEW